MMKSTLSVCRWCALSIALLASSCSNAKTNSSTTDSPESTTTPSQTSHATAPAAGAMPPGAVFPTAETVKTGAYIPLSRPLFIYVNKASLKNPAVVEYLRYYLSDEGQALVPEVGYVQLDTVQIADQRKKLEEAIGGASGTTPSSSLDGEVRIDGSSTVAPISSAVTEEFAAINRKVRAPVGTKGTSGGFKRFVTGEIDICDASRPIKEPEIQACLAANIEFIELTIAIDGLTVVVNPQNDWVAGMTVAQLKQIWEPDSKVTRWSDVDPSWPAEPIKLFGPGTDSGTFEYFTEAVVGEARKSRADYQASENDNILVTGVSGEKYALGYFGYAYYIENKDQLKALAIAP